MKVFSKIVSVFCILAFFVPEIAAAAITFIGAASSSATTVTIPAHKAGDLIVIAAFRANSATAPTTPTAGGAVPTWTQIQSGGANGIALKTAYAVATAGTTTSGTWTNAQGMMALVYRGTASTNPVVTSATGNGSATTNCVYPALTASTRAGSSWIGRIAFRATKDQNIVNNLPADYRLRWSAATSTAPVMVMLDRADILSNPVADTVTCGAQNSAYRAHTFEIVSAPFRRVRLFSANTVKVLNGRILIYQGG